MAWTNPPTFSDGATASAANLNILSNDIEYLKGIVDAPNSPFPSLTATSDETVDFWFRHTHRYMHYHFYVETGTTQDHLHVEIYNSADTLLITWEDNGDNAGPYTFQGSFDCNSLSVGTWYRANVDIAIVGAGGGNPIYLIYLEERNTA